MGQAKVGLRAAQVSRNGVLGPVEDCLVEVLKRCGDNLTRENIMKQAASLKDLEIPMLLPGIKVNTSASDFYPIQAVRLSRFKGETWEVFSDIISNESPSN